MNENLNALDFGQYSYWFRSAYVELTPIGAVRGWVAWCAGNEL